MAKDISINLFPQSKGSKTTIFIRGCKNHPDRPGTQYCDGWIIQYLCYDCMLKFGHLGL